MTDPDKATVSFTVPGLPQPQGSSRAFVTKAGKAVVTSANPKLRSWRLDVATAARAVWPGGPYTGPVLLYLDFQFSRPKGHYGSGKNAQVLKASAPVAHTQKPDLDKLTRATLDALKGILYRDDSQVDGLRATKGWTTGAPETWVEVMM